MPKKTLKNKTLAIVLALFLGHFGAHYFYLERPVKGLLMFLFMWTFIPSFIALYQVIRYAFMNEEAWNKYVGTI